MPRYVVLYKFTDQGVKDIKNSPQRLENATKALEAMGGKMIDFYTTMGEYDMVAIGELPNDEAAMTFSMAIGALGNVRSTTMKAFDRKQATDIINKLP